MGMEISLRIITSFLISISASILAEILYPIFLKKEKENEEKAKEEHSVHFSKKLARVYIGMLIFLNIIGILIIALPKVITEFLEFNYVATICVWWIPIIFDDVVACIFSTKATYDDEKIVVKKLFRKPKVYYYSDIISFTKTRNLKVETTKGKFLLFNSLSGTDSLRKVIAEKTSQV